MKAEKFLEGKMPWEVLIAVETGGKEIHSFGVIVF